jgi:hypothetical protein
MEPQPDDAREVKLAVIEVLDREGHARLLVPAWRWPVTIGRAIDCDVVLDDVHAAPRHVALAEREGVLTLLVGETVNGVQLTHRRLAAAQSADLSPGEIFQIGSTRLRVRRASDALLPERPLMREPAAGRIATLVLLLALSAWNAGALWLSKDTGGRFMDYLPVLLGIPVMLAFWSGFWSVGSKLVRHRFDFWAHANVALRYMLIVGVVELVLPLAAFALGWAFLSRVSSIATSSLLWAMVLAHLLLIHPARRRLLAGVMGAMLIAGVSLFLIRNYQVHDHLFSELYVTRLGPPALRLAPTVPTTRFIDEARDLKSVLDAHVNDDDAGGSSSSGFVSTHGPDGR